jgi:hypothetical protein
MDQMVNRRITPMETRIKDLVRMNEIPVMKEKQVQMKNRW